MRKKKVFHTVSTLKFTRDRIILIIDGKEYEFPLKSVSTRLAHATKEQRVTYKIDPYGYGIHWPLVDEDLSIDGLLNNRISPM